MVTKARSAGQARAVLPSGGPTRAEGARRNEILDAAARLFASAGYVGTSVKDVADACGILPGSLYHHFDSKEALVIELVTRYQEELEAVGNAALAAIDDPVPIYDQILALATSIAECALRHRAALQLTSYEPHTTASGRFVELARRRPQSSTAAMAELLRRGRAAGLIKPGIDVSLLSAELCEGMRHVGNGELHRDADARQVGGALCHLVLDGGATEPPDDAPLDRSSALLAAEQAVSAWNESAQSQPDGKTAQLVSVARTEFARRGYEATTIRDIAAAAGMGTGSVYRVIDSKEALLDTIMGAYDAKLSDAYDAVLAQPGPAVEKLDALTWVNIHALQRFGPERDIQRAWLRAVPPPVSESSDSRPRRAEQIHSTVAEGLRRGELRAGSPGVPEPPLGVLAMCFRDLIWPVAVAERTDARSALLHCRATLLRGAVDEHAHALAVL